MSKSRAKKLGGLAFLLVVVASGLLIQCRTKTSSSSKNVLSSLQPSFRVFQQEPGWYKIRFPGSKLMVADGQTVDLALGVVQKYPGDELSCDALPVWTQANLKRNDDYFEVEFGFDDRAFERCTDSSENGKLSMDCMFSGDWEGPKTMEACVFDSNGNMIAAGRGAPEGRMINDGFGLREQIPHENTVLSYGKVCAERLGSLPRDWSCLDGEIIPITRDGVEVPFGEHQPGDKCDNQIYLDLGNQGQCVPYARLGRLQTKPDVETVFICRRYKIGNYLSGGRVSDHIPPDAPLFQDVAIVQHNVKTGETCYFQALSGFQSGGRDLPAVRIPPPDEEEIPTDIAQKYADLPREQQLMKASEFWIKPSAPGTDNTQHGRGFQCIRCHDSDPFIHTPYVDQLNYVFPNGHPFAGRNDKMVPCNPTKDGQAANPQCLFTTSGYASGKYSLLHATRQEMWPQAWAVAPKNDDTCVSCHRLGTMRTCRAFARDSAGDNYVNGEFVTEYGKMFPESHWMPIHEDYFADQKSCKPNPEDPANPIGCNMNLQLWKQAFGRGAQRTLECCQLAQSNRSGFPEDDSMEFQDKCVRMPVSELPPATGGVNEVELVIDQEFSIKDREMTRAEFNGNGGGGRLTYLALKLDIYHDNHGDVRVELVHNGERTTVFDGQDLASPNAYGPLLLNFSTADYNSPLAEFLNQSSGGQWELRIYDEGLLEEGELKEASLVLGTN